MNIDIETKILRAIGNNSFKLQSGKRDWYQYSVIISELIWARNNHDGYLIDVYDKSSEQHLTRMTV